jgi:hypothetical protein
MAVRNLQFKLEPNHGQYTVQLTVGPGDTAQGEFDVELLSRARTREVISRIQSDACHLDDLRDFGTQLWDALFPPAVASLFNRIREEADKTNTQLHLRLCVPSKLEELPWETLYEHREAGFLAANDRFAIIRDPGGRVAPLAPPAHGDRKVSILAVIPEGSGLGGAEHEWKNLTLAIGPPEQFIELERLAGRVTPERLKARLSERQWDILHFIGHGELDERGAAKLRLNGETPNDGDCWVDAEIFGEVFRGTPVRLAVLNCCLGGRASPSRSLGGVGPFLLRSGVPATVAMQYVINDDVAVKFSDVFYAELLRGADRGRVDLALARARRAVMLDQGEGTVRGFITPILHLTPGCERLFDLPGDEKIGPAREPVRAQRPASLVPDELVDALRCRRCVLVIGPGVLSAGAVRGGPPPPGPRELAQRLATESNYPHSSELDLTGRTGEWITGLLLPAVCQHYEHTKKRYPLISAIQRSYRNARPPATLQSVAQWPVPFFVYTHFDGLLEEALRVAGKAPRVVSGVVPNVDLSVGDTLLLNVRGTLKNENSLILTEEDHDGLWDYLGKLPPTMVDMVRGRAGQAALFLGISPRDPLVKRLSSRLLESGQRRLQGPTFFVSADPSDVDDAFWDKFDVRWLPMQVDELVTGINDAMVSS